HVEPLSLLRAPHGVLYVTGNHEYYWGVERWLEKIKQLGMQPLLNENLILNIGGAKILIAGVTDTSAEMFKVEHRSDPRKAIKNSDNSDFKVLLAHRPDSYLEAEAAGFNLQLSGHTHAGQFFPFNFIVALVHKYYRGLNLYKRMWVYVNSGTGYWGPANRFAVPSEITLIELKRS
ncbi:MAG: metallophosphoesterase, partial [Bdellovibrionales bacterium]